MVREVCRKVFDTAELAGNSQQEVLVILIQPRQRPYGVAGIGPNAKLADAADIDGYAHSPV